MLAGVLLPLVILLACAPGSTARRSPTPSHSPSKTAQARATATPSPSPTALAPPQPLHFQVQPIATGLVTPWQIVFGPNGMALVTERPGRVRALQDGQLQPDPLLTLPVSSTPGNESGLLGMALHPAFPNPPWVYLYYTYGGASGKVNRVSRFTYTAGKLASEQVLLDGIPGGVCCHFGGRLAFGPDGDLYVTVGEAQQPQRAQDAHSLNGKILRLGADGGVPADNPFPGSPVYAFGFRNPEGLAWDPSGHLYVSDNGPTGDLGMCCHDEIDLVTAGGFYGWPLYAGNTSTGQQPAGPLPNPVPAIVESGMETWAPSGMTFYAPAPGQQPTLLVATLRGQALRRFVIDPAHPDHVVTQEVVLSGYGRLRAVVAGADRCLYVLTSNRDGRGSPQADDDRVLRACPG